MAPPHADMVRSASGAYWLDSGRAPSVAACCSCTASGRASRRDGQVGQLRVPVNRASGPADLCAAGRGGTSARAAASRDAYTGLCGERGLAGRNHTVVEMGSHDDAHEQLVLFSARRSAGARCSSRATRRHAGRIEHRPVARIGALVGNPKHFPPDGTAPFFSFYRPGNAPKSTTPRSTGRRGSAASQAPTPAPWRSAARPTRSARAALWR